MKTIKRPLVGVDLYRELLSLFDDAEDSFEDAPPPAPDGGGDGPAPPPIAADLAGDIEEARNFPEGFPAWMRHWRFTNRETGHIMTFRNPWPGQAAFADLMAEIARQALDRSDWYGIFALKAGKLGFTELECCWDGYVVWSKRNGRVHLFSKEEDAAKEILGYVKSGLKRMEPAWGIRFLSSQLEEITAERAGTKVFKMTVAHHGERDFTDVRTVQAYATGRFPAINDSCQHAHVDEWCHMDDPVRVWGSINTIIAPGGTAHIVSRGAGEHKEVEDTWQAAVDGLSKLRAYFAPWHARPDRDRRWYEEQAASSPTQAALAHYAAENPGDAFLGDEENDFVPIEVWDRRAEIMCCASGHFHQGEGADAWRRDCPDCNACDAGAPMHSYLRTHPLMPGDPMPSIIGADAATSHDTFGCVLATRHPLRPDDPAIRLRKSWAPEMFADGIIDYNTVESWLRMVCEGGCPLGHPTYDPWRGGKMCKPMKDQLWEPGECPACAAGEFVPPFNIYQIAYDPYQLTQMMQNLRRDAVTWCNEISQGLDRLAADRTFFDVIVGGRLGHTGDDLLREHINNAKAKTQKDEDSKLRIIKKAQHRRVDLAVASSMAVSECLRLNL